MFDTLSWLAWLEQGKEPAFWTLYFSLFLALSLFGLHRLQVIYLYLKTKNKAPLAEETIETLPSVTIQLPVFNEIYVVERLVEAVSSIDYPKDLLEIQILDDSTDETAEACRRIAELHLGRGEDIVCLHRGNRTGFKAGALQNGLEQAKGEFIAIFDSDFIPPRDFLKKTLPHFRQTEVGMVQARWGHTNRHCNLLTQVQALLLDGHFILEHGARNRSGRFFNFNGTAGVWRKACIRDAGGWQHDTLTEDVDLSYRAQLKGWKFLFLPEVVVPAELPVEMNSFKTQQHRWVKGGIQTAKKILPMVFKSDQPLKVKIEACFHLLANLAYVLVLLLSVLMPMSLLFPRHEDPGALWAVNAAVFLLTAASIGWFYLMACTEAGQKWHRGLLYLPLLFSLGLAMCINNSRAVFEALRGSPSDFERTPKFNISSGRDRSWVNKAYRVSLNPSAIWELGMGIYFTIAIGFALERGFYSSIPFMVLFQAGFLYIGLLSLFQAAFLKMTSMAQKRLKAARTLG